MKVRLTRFILRNRTYVETGFFSTIQYLSLIRFNTQLREGLDG